MEEKRVVLSFWSFTLVGITIGVCSGVLLGGFTAVTSLFSGEFAAALIAIPAAVIGNGLSVGILAALGFIIYKPAISRFSKLAILSGRFEEPKEPGDVAFAESSNKSLKSGDGP
jgi:hypothetical protein